MKLRQEPLHRPDDRAGRGGPSQSDGIGNGTDRHHDFLDNDIFWPVDAGLLDIQDEPSIPALQYFDGTQTCSEAVHDCYRLDQLHSNASQTPGLPARLLGLVDQSVKSAMSAFSNSDEGGLKVNELTNYATSGVTQTTRVAA